MLELYEPFRFEPLSVSTMLEIQRKVTNEYGMPKEYITVKMHNPQRLHWYIGQIGSNGVWLPLMLMEYTKKQCNLFDIPANSRIIEF